jgi:glucosamine-6-phosphate deaminase
MRVIQAASRDEAVAIVASLVLEKIQAHPASVIGLATGRTMEPVYARFCELVAESKVSLAKTFFFMLDEYRGLPDDHPSSFKYYIQSHLLRPLGIPESQVAFPPAAALDGPERYEAFLRESNGVDLQLLGIGQNGHVGFNEPGSEKDSRTRFVRLTDETLEANRGQFTDVTPREALSMGIGTIREAKRLLLLATGTSKAEVIKHLLNHHDDPGCPATFLKDHPHFTLVLDPAAASRINLKI